MPRTWHRLLRGWWLVGAGILLVAGTGAGASIWLLPAAAVCLAAAWRRARRAPAVLVAVALLLAVAAQLHLRLEARRWRSHSEQRVGAALEGLELRARRLYSILQDLSLKAAALPDAPAALSGDTAALGRLFRELERLRAPLRERPAVGIDTPQMTTVAWSGRLGNTVALRGLLADRPDIYLLEGNVTTTLVGHAPIRGPAGQPLGHAIASLPLAVRRNISNDFLRDFDVLAAGDPGVELRYLDARSDDGQPRAAFPPLDPALAAREGVLRTPRGSALAVVRVTAPALPAVQSQLLARYRRLIALVLLAAIAVALWQRRPPSAGVVLLAATGGRGLLLALGVPAPAPGSTVLSPEIYASPLLGPLLRSPLDLFLTAAWLLVAVVALWRLTAPALGRHASWRWAPAAVVLAAAALAAVFHLVSDTLANTALEIDAIPLLPQSPAHLLIQVSLLFMLASALIVVTLGLTTLPRLSRAPSSLALHLLVGPALVVLLTLPRPASWPPPPLVPAAILVLAGALLAGWRDGWELRLRSASPGTRAALVLLAVAGLALVLYPSLNHYASVATRARIETDYAPLVERQPQWREYMLAETRRRVDSLRLLGDAAPPGAQMPGVEELAFAVWSATDLAAFGLSSAVEIQDARGAVISRFALNLPSLAGPPQDVPPNDGWRVSPERLTLASAEQGVLHARRRLSYDGQTHGGVHVFVADDYWNLPFLRGRDPYSILFRTASPPAARERPVALVVYGEHRDVVFSSVDHPPLLEPSLAARLTTGMGQWTRLPVDGQPHHAYVFRSGDQIHVLAYPELTAARYVADMVEAAAGVSLVGVLVFLALVSVRTLLGRRSLSLGTMVRTVKSRFALRVFVAFIVLAALPVVVLQVVVRDFLLDRLDREFQEQALERAAVAKKAVEDFAFFQRGEAASGQPVTDAAMVWLSSVVRNDLDVFERGRLLASSKRELYASGLLAPRVSGAVFRDLVLEGRSSVLRRERIGDFTYLVASVPVRLEKGEPGILAIPLALRQREVQATVADLDRTIRLAAVGFLALAAALAQSLARRISGPISELTRATRRIAQGDLDARVTARSQDELQRLVESFNQMAGDLDRQRRDLERSNRLAAWAEMARQVAHEVKNPLTPIQLSAEHLRRVYHDPDVDFARALESCTQTILKQVGNLRGMVTEFSSFARPPATELEPVDPGALVADVVRPYAEALPPGVHLSVEAPSGLPPVRGDRRLLHRAVVNLVENALQAVGERGEVAVLARTLDGRVEIDVRDSGPGIAPELREKVFEPFFSTKTTGSGLGLALVRKIAEDHGGGVSLDSAAGRGTRALLWLPASARDNDT